MAGLFVAGTDTEIGKTLITASLAAYLRQKAYSCGVMKPLESGCLSGSKNSDSYFLKKISGTSDDIDQITTYAFEAPLAPGVAAEIEGVKISLDFIKEAHQRLKLLHQMVLVEGAGGLLVPLSAHKSMVDLIEVLELPVLLVARLGLGTINHTLLSLEYLKQRSIPVAGIILNQNSKHADLSTQYNLSTLEKWTKIPVWGVMPFLEHPKKKEELLLAISREIGPKAEEYFCKGSKK